MKKAKASPRATQNNNVDGSYRRRSDHSLDTKVGEFALRGPNIMLGYVEAGESQRNSMTSDGFMRTGDIGYVDDRGYLFIVDRAKEMIKVKGYKTNLTIYSKSSTNRIFSLITGIRWHLPSLKRS